MHEQSFEHVLVPAYVRTPETSGLIQMNAGSLQQLPALPEESLLAVAADPASISIDRVAFGLLIDPRLSRRSGSLMSVRISSVSRS